MVSMAGRQHFGVVAAPADLQGRDGAVGSPEGDAHLGGGGGDGQQHAHGASAQFRGPDGRHRRWPDPPSGPATGTRRA